MQVESLSRKVERLLREHPTHCTIAEVARAMGLSLNGARKHRKSIPHMMVEGVYLYERHAAMKLATTFKKRYVSVQTFRGRELEVIREICRTYYRTQFDVAGDEHLALAKRVAGV